MVSKKPSKQEGFFLFFPQKIVYLGITNLNIKIYVRFVALSLFEKIYWSIAGVLGLNPQKPFAKSEQPKTVEAKDSNYESLGEKPQWTGPGHTIERNEQAKQMAKLNS